MIDGPYGKDGNDGSPRATRWTRLHQEQQCASAYINSVSASINKGDRAPAELSPLCKREQASPTIDQRRRTDEALRRDVNQQW